MSSAGAGGAAPVFSHPRGLYYLAFTEAWERFSYYGMTGLLALYMVDALLPTLGGQTGLNVGMACFDQGILAKHNVKMIGADREAIFRGEDRPVRTPVTQSQKCQTDRQCDFGLEKARNRAD